MLGGGGIKAAAKRTAFGDVSNTFNGLRPSKDDLTIPTKPGVQVANKPTLVVQEKRSAAFLRPAQRPLSVSSLKGLLNGVTGAVINDTSTRQTTGEVGIPSQVANSRKVLTKRNTTIFKDPSLQTVEEAVAGLAPQIHVPATTYPPLQATTKPVPSLRPSTAIATITEEPTKDSREPSGTVTFAAQHETAVNPTIASSEVLDSYTTKSDGIYIDDQGDLRIYQENIENIPEVQRPIAVKAVKPEQLSMRVESYEMATKVALPLQAVQPTLPRYTQPLPSEREEYWNEEDEDNYDEEGYATAHSYHSRGENTTGGATTVLFPHANQKAKREIAAAKQMVEATRTPEDIEEEFYDTSMVAEYGEEIFEYMKQLEVGTSALSSETTS